MATQHKTTGKKATKNHAAKAQCKKLLAYLIVHGYISTITARKVLDIIYAPARIYELKKQGYQIEIRRINQAGHSRISEYHLVTKQFFQADLFEGVSHE